jgi:CRP-like cAMP-binding protein
VFFHAQGEAGLEMYMLLQGEVEVTRDGPAAAFPGGEVKSVPERLGFLSEGSFFGELPVLSRDIDAEIRTRTVTAVTYCKLAYLTRDDVAGLMKQYPVLRIRVNRFRNLCLRTLRRSGDVKRRKGQLLSDDDLIKAQVLANRAKVRETILRGGERGLEAMECMAKAERQVTRIQAAVRGNFVRSPSADWGVLKSAVRSAAAFAAAGAGASPQPANSLNGIGGAFPRLAAGAAGAGGLEDVIARVANLEAAQTTQYEAMQAKLRERGAQMQPQVDEMDSKLEQLLSVLRGQNEDRSG